jgi:hypothetical protein
MGWLQSFAALRSAPFFPSAAAVGGPHPPAPHPPALLAFLADQLPPRPSILDTGLGDFTLDLLRLDPRELLAVGPDPQFLERLRVQCARQGLSCHPLQVCWDAPRWVLPRLTATVWERQGWFDLVRLGQCEGWPSACQELAHAGTLLQLGGFLMVDGLSSRPGAHRRAEPPGYRFVLEFGSGLVFEKISQHASLHGWERPYTLSVASVRPTRPV